MSEKLLLASLNVFLLIFFFLLLFSDDCNTQLKFLLITAQYRGIYIW